jgi:hypothetical protein
MVDLSSRSRQLFAVVVKVFEAGLGSVSSAPCLKVYLYL